MTPGRSDLGKPAARSGAERPIVLYLIWLVLVGAALEGLASARYSVAFVAVGTLVFSLAPLWSARFLHVVLPSGFIAAIAIFLCAALLLGEVGGFYQRFWWWDVALHAGSAMGFGLIGVILMFLLVKSDKLAAAPITVSVFAFSFAVMIGAVWEIFEFSLDQIFGLNTQRSGLVDTMWDLIIDCLGAGIGATAGWLYLKGYVRGPLTATLRAFFGLNPGLFHSQGPVRDPD